MKIDFSHRHQFRQFARQIIYGVIILIFWAPSVSALSQQDLDAINQDWPNWVPYTCAGPSGDGTVITSASQANVAEAIIGIAKTDNLGQSGALIGLMVGLTESGLKIYANKNVPVSLDNPAAQAVGSNFDSVGVFQQRPSAGWSTIATGPAADSNRAAVWQLMDPAYSAEAFFGSPPGSNAPSALRHGLMNLSDWQSMSPWQAAQAVQGSGTSDGSNYRAAMKTASGLLDKFWNDAPAVTLPVPITGGDGSGSTGSSSVSTCTDGYLGDIGQGTGKFTNDPSITYPGVQHMLARAKELGDGSSPLFKQVCGKYSTNCHDMCDYLMGEAWGYLNSGYATAAIHWQTMLSSGHGHPNSRKVPVGALLFYATGRAAGHIAIYLGNNMVLTNDVDDGKTGRTGGAYVVSASELENGPWRLTYLGWSDPVFAGAKDGRAGF